MSVYEFEVTVPAGTPADAPVSDVLQLEHGIIHRVIIDMPVGANHLVLVALDRGLHQLIPSNPSGNIASNLIPRVWDTWLPLEEELSVGRILHDLEDASLPPVGLGQGFGGEV